MIAGYSGKDLLEDHPESGAFPQPESEAMRRWPMPTLFISGDREGGVLQLVSHSLVRWMPVPGRSSSPAAGTGCTSTSPSSSTPRCSRSCRT